jgi:glucose-1-phosphate cytidylyltransferase
MKVLILAGGLGTRLSEETELKPKPMVEIGGMPIIWHIMKIYEKYGHTEFIILLGYKGYLIKEYFMNYFLHRNDVTVDLKENKTLFHGNAVEPWTITLVDTGVETMTGGRIKRARKYVGDERFMLTYGDGLSNINMSDQLDFHKSHGKLVTMAAVQPDGKFGAFNHTDDGKVSRFIEKPRGDGSWINGGFFICESGVFDYIEDSDSVIFEQSPLQNLAADGQLFIYKHPGFWKCMDTLRDKLDLNNLWTRGDAPWKTW